ncbi:hypothetical protein [Cryptosporidium parvum Iowa II]|uniref:Uncharacterized protein n=2 Tax=Cryptosporidium parvum TaxID=5807 RepID=Q5CS36_CRYPI|nr:hypothetical protein [Cryptosporidium parvum Iowa II]EAK88175.1 hypothetical protein cgd5_380 [Cryptosporidium parvum Iowa II]QOY41471.1 Uncharacterized protein CPATCC_0022160 [Cryptosporidium parvum]WKS77691.1 hypothetical protein CPCDC_5g380 [Cryptosporidium sp. 43IA8]WRK32182.1 Uncharacterized protein cpbgf_500380 [Cryptosporidium parvum]|eukprot:QOY41471.1 hypothetical protein CPATCC_002030 [Cryptosporidium parvum]
MDVSEANHYNNSNKYEPQIMNNASSTSSSSSLKELCGLLLSSFCGILDDFGLETQADEQMLLIAIETGDFDSVIEYVKLFRNKISSILLLNNISRDFRTDIDIIKDVDNLQDGVYEQIGDIKRNSLNNNSINIDVNEFEQKIDLNNNQEFVNLKLLSPNSITNNNNNNNNSNNIKKSPVPPLNVEKAGPGSWNRGQLPNEYPIE